jgi:hypothetical protein
MIAVGMGDDCPVHRLPRIYVEITGLTVESTAREREEGHAEK